MKPINFVLNKIEANKKLHFWLFFTVLFLLTSFMMVCYFPSEELRFGHDTYFHLQRIKALMEALKNGSFPIYIDYEAINGYGYATKWFYPDVILIPFAFLGNLTNLTFAYKSILFIMTLLSGLFTYLAVKSVYKASFAATISALLYTFCIYRLLDLFERGALGEVLAFAFIPLIMWGIYEIINANYKKWYILTIGYSLLIFSHLLSSVLVFIVILTLLLFYYKSLIKEPKRILYIFLASIVTVFITAYYWLPMLEQMLSNKFYYSSHSLDFGKGHGMSVRMLIRSLLSGLLTPNSVFSVGIGFLLTLSVCLRIFIKQKSENLRNADVGVILGIIIIIICSEYFPWWIWPFNKLSFIQAPWRFFIFASYFFALAGGYYLFLLVKEMKWRMLVISVIIFSTMIIIFRESNSYKAKSIVITPTSIAPTLKFNYHMGGLEYIPAKIPSIDYIDKRENIIRTNKEETVISDLHKINGRLSFYVKSDKPEKLELPLLYYKGYRAKINNGKINLPITQSANGMVELSINHAANYKIEVYYAGTFLQKTGFTITLISIIVFCVYIIVVSRKRNALNG